MTETIDRLTKYSANNFLLFSNFRFDLKLKIKPAMKIDTKIYSLYHHSAWKCRELGFFVHTARP